MGRGGGQPPGASQLVCSGGASRWAMPGHTIHHVTLHRGLESPPAPAFTFNCLDIRVIRQLKQIKATYLPGHNREEADSFFTSQWLINAGDV